MAQLSPSQLQWRARIETGLRFAGPVLDLLLAAGDRVSRLLVRDERDHLTMGDDADDRPALTHGGD